MEQYLSQLPADKSLCIYLNNKLYFSSKGKWLHPLFDFEEFLKNNPAEQELSAHDTAVGKAAAFLMVRNNITKIHANLASKLAVEYINYINKKGAKVIFTYDTLIDSLQCQTEKELKDLFEEEQIYLLLKARLEKSRQY